MWTKYGLLAVFLVHCALASLNNPIRSLTINKHLTSKRAHKSGESPLVAKTDDSSKYEAYFDQLIDHFSQSSKTFKQRYFVNTEFAKKKHVHILYLEGDGPASDDKVTNVDYPHVHVAKSVGATVWTLEHRFQGESQPFTCLSKENLQYLSSKQAVEDIAQFITIQNQKSGESNPKWIVYGGSYAGSLALWLSQIYPDLTAGVVASAAFQQPSDNFYNYQRDVEAAYQAYDPTCSKNIADAIQTVRNLVQSRKGQQKLTELFSLNPPLESTKLRNNDLQYFFNNIALWLQLPVEYNHVNLGPFRSAAGISDVCQIFANQTNDGVTNAAQLANYLYTTLLGEFDGVNNAYDDLVNYLKTEQFGDSYQASARTATWLQCSELGLFQTSDYGGGFFGSHIPNNYFLELCADVFGSDFNIDVFEESVTNTQKYYNEHSVFTGKNAVIINGGADPWRSLGYTSGSDKSVVVYTADGAAHCADLQPPTSYDSSSVKYARTVARRRVRAWANRRHSDFDLTVDEAKVADTDEIEDDSDFEQSGGLDRATFKIISEKEKSKKFVESKLSTKTAALRQPKEWHLDIMLDVKRPKTARRRQSQKHAPFSHILRRPSLEDLIRRKFSKKQIARRTKIAEKYFNYGYITQNVDHFNTDNTQKYKQYFLYNNNYRLDDNSPNFLMLGGEGPIGLIYVTNFLVYVNWAKHFNATVYTLEHRFYGESQPFQFVTTENLAYLTTEQALADAAVFITSENKRRNADSPKWVVFGGSYPGNLAAWFRVRYPDLTVGAIASSAPVQSKTDYFGYLQVVENSTKIFGSPNCADDVQTFFAWLQHGSTTIKGRKQISQLFYLCDLWNEDYVVEKDLQTITSEVINFISGYVQYDDERHYSLRAVCDVFNELVEMLDNFHGENIKKAAKLLKDMMMHKLPNHGMPNESTKNSTLVASNHHKIGHAKNHYHKHHEKKNIDLKKHHAQKKEQGKKHHSLKSRHHKVQAQGQTQIHQKQHTKHAGKAHQKHALYHKKSQSLVLSKLAGNESTPHSAVKKIGKNELKKKPHYKKHHAKKSAAHKVQKQANVTAHAKNAKRNKLTHLKKHKKAGKKEHHIQHHQKHGHHKRHNKNHGKHVSKVHSSSTNVTAANSTANPVQGLLNNLQIMANKLTKTKHEKHHNKNLENIYDYTDSSDSDYSDSSSDNTDSSDATDSSSDDTSDDTNSSDDSSDDENYSSDSDDSDDSSDSNADSSDSSDSSDNTDDSSSSSADYSNDSDDDDYGSDSDDDDYDSNSDDDDYGSDSSDNDSSPSSENSSNSSSSSSNDDDYNDDTSNNEPRLYCSDVSYEALVDYMQIMDPRLVDTSMRCWIYQACTAWGYHQSSNFGYNIFETSVPVDFYVDLCRDVFGDEYTRDVTDAGVDASNALYGGKDNFTATNVVFPNGSEDPWHVLSVLHDIPQNDVTSILMDGTSHCYDMMGGSAYDNEELKHVRRRIRNIIAKWLKTN